jgi:hypothetical protein
MNAFLELADRQISSPRKARMRAAEKREDKAQERLALLYEKRRKEQVAKLLAGPHGEAARALIAFLDAMTLNHGKELISVMEPWRSADANTRFEVLSLADSAIMKLREQRNWPVFDDPLPSAPPSVFLIIREMLK